MSCCGCSRGSAIGAVALEVLPIETVTAFVIWLAFRDVLIFADHTVDDVVNLVIANAHTPTMVAYRVVNALQPGVTL